MDAVILPSTSQGVMNDQWGRGTCHIIFGVPRHSRGGSSSKIITHEGKGTIADNITSTHQMAVPSELVYKPSNRPGDGRGSQNLVGKLQSEFKFVISFAGKLAGIRRVEERERDRVLSGDCQRQLGMWAVAVGSPVTAHVCSGGTKRKERDGG
ncbi:hypothetical protein FNV43_RR00219 [Rhamnella rubrinervis]|uniref:Uncharacterized protein n=1 Tax=Rhamnella rubrinervis TaxID=2594499 RepID=A0A8K0MQZ5_9ROSA|nr:hypothetical protein FNV43_RR00219 [Rhamnella rubrinervis]